MTVFSQFTTTTRFDFSRDKIFDKHTGKRLTEQELIKIVKENPHTKFEPIINKYGEPDHYIYDAFKKDSNINTDLSTRPKNGEDFPPFVMQTIDNQTIRSEELNGKFILLHFQLDFNKPFFNIKSLTEVNSFIKELSSTIGIVSIVLSRGEKESILKAVNPSEYNMYFVSEANNFNLRYVVFNFPTFILIDKNGKLVSYYRSDEISKIKEAILKNG